MIQNQIRLVMVTLPLRHAQRSRITARWFYRWVEMIKALRTIIRVERVRDLIVGDAPRRHSGSPENTIFSLGRDLARLISRTDVDFQALARERGKESGRRLTTSCATPDRQDPSDRREYSNKENDEPRETLPRATQRVRALGSCMVKLFEAYASPHGRLSPTRAVSLFKDVDVVPSLATEQDVRDAVGRDCDYDGFCVVVARLGMHASIRGEHDSLRTLFLRISGTRAFYEANNRPRRAAAAPTATRAPTRAMANNQRTEPLLRRWR